MLRFRNARGYLLVGWDASAGQSYLKGLKPEGGYVHDLGETRTLICGGDLNLNTVSTEPRYRVAEPRSLEVQPSILPPSPLSETEG